MHGDEGMADGLGQLDLGAVLQGVAVGRHQHQAVGAEVDGLQFRRVHRAGHDAQVGGAVAHAAHDVARQPLLQVHGHARMPGQVAGQQVGHELGDRRGVGEDADMAGVAVGLFLEVVLQVVHLAQDHARMLQQALAGGRDLHAPAVAVQQAGIELVLQRLDAHADRGQRQVGALGRLRQAGDSAMWMNRRRSGRSKCMRHISDVWRTTPSEVSSGQRGAGFAGPRLRP